MDGTMNRTQKMKMNINSGDNVINAKSKCKWKKYCNNIEEYDNDAAGVNIVEVIYVLYVFVF
jgi:hypothetical protein